MDRHIDELLKIVPDLLRRNILDLGAGRGRFMIAILKRGGKVSGVEPYDKYIDIAKTESKKEGFELELKEGVGENIPFLDAEFGFVNMTEVIEHVADPRGAMREVFRVLKSDGQVYISVPNRYGFKDQHFNLYFVNWLPRSLAHDFISLFGKHKDYSGENGLQRLSEMHYMTLGKAKNIFESLGFMTEDIREIKIKNKFLGLKRFGVRLFYKILRPWYFDSFHLLLTKKNG